MDQLIDIVEGIYLPHALNGKLHIYNLFSLQNPESESAIDCFERLVRLEEIRVEDSLVDKKELSQHPWILIGWGINDERKWTKLQQIKDLWLQLIKEVKIPTIYKKHKRGKGYYHPCPRTHVGKRQIVNDLIRIYKDKFRDSLNLGGR